MLDVWAHVDSLCRMHLLEDYKHYSIVGSKARAIYKQTRCYAYRATIGKHNPANKVCVSPVINIILSCWCVNDLFGVCYCLLFSLMSYGCAHASSNHVRRTQQQTHARPAYVCIARACIGECLIRLIPLVFVLGRRSFLVLFADTIRYHSKLRTVRMYVEITIVFG